MRCRRRCAGRCDKGVLCRLLFLFGLTSLLVALLLPRAIDVSRPCVVKVGLHVDPGREGSAAMPRACNRRGAWKKAAVTVAMALASKRQADVKSGGAPRCRSSAADNLNSIAVTLREHTKVVYGGMNECDSDLEVGHSTKSHSSQMTGDPTPTLTGDEYSVGISNFRVSYGGAFINEVSHTGVL